MRRKRFSPAQSTWYLPFCSAWTGSTRAALRAGTKAAIMLVSDAEAMAKHENQRVDDGLLRVLRTPNIVSIMLAGDAGQAAGEDQSERDAGQRADQRRRRALSPRKSVRIWPRVAPSARRMPISPRRCVTAMEKEL